MSTQVSRNRKRTLIFAAALCGLALAVVAYVVAANMRSEVPVADGYYLVRADSRSVVLCAPRVSAIVGGSVIVDEQIREIGVVDGMIVGRTVDPGAYAYPGWSFPVGYFIVDSKTGKVTAGVTKEQLANLTGHTPVLQSPFSWALWHW